MKLSDEYAFLTTNLQTLAPLEIGMAEEFRMSSSPLNSITLCNLPVLLFRYTRTSKNQYRFLHGLNTRICTNHQLIVSPLHNRALRMFDYTSYFVTIGFSNTVQLRLLGNYSVMLVLLESLLCCLARHFFLLFFLLFPSLFLLLSFPHVTKTCYSISVCQVLRKQAYTKTLATFESCNWFCHG